MKDELFEAQLLRAIGYAPYGGADAGECLAAARGAGSSGPRTISARQDCSRWAPRSIRD
jgi:hypothetical protein